MKKEKREKKERGKFLDLDTNQIGKDPHHLLCNKQTKNLPSTEVAFENFNKPFPVTETCVHKRKKKKKEGPKKKFFL